MAKYVLKKVISVKWKTIINRFAPEEDWQHVTEAEKLFQYNHFKKLLMTAAVQQSSANQMFHKLSVLSQHVCIILHHRREKIFHTIIQNQ